MEKRIENYVNGLFKDAPKTPQAEEVKAEIIGNTIEKFNEMKAEGRDDETAFNIAIAYIGNVSELINEYNKDENVVRLNEVVQKHKARQALLLSIAIALYILCVIPVIIFGVIGGLEEIGVCLMFVMIAVATGLIIYRANTNKLYSDAKTPNAAPIVFETPVTKEQKRRRMFRKSLMSAMWSLITVIYILVSFLTGAWHITWIIFLIGGAIDSLMKAIFDYKEWYDEEEDNEK